MSDKQQKETVVQEDSKKETTPVQTKENSNPDINAQLLQTLQELKKEINSLKAEKELEKEAQNSINSQREILNSQLQEFRTEKETEEMIAARAERAKQQFAFDIQTGGYSERDQKDNFYVPEVAYARNDLLYRTLAAKYKRDIKDFNLIEFNKKYKSLNRHFFKVEGDR